MISSKKLLATCILFLIFTHVGLSQTVKPAEKKYNYEWLDKPLLEVLQTLENNHLLSFRYKYEWLESKRLSLSIKQKTTSEILRQIAAEAKLEYVVFQDRLIVFLKGGKKQVRLNNDDKSYNSDQVITLGSMQVGQTEAILSGKVLAAENNKPLPGVNVRSIEDDLLATTDIDGNYQIQLPVGFNTIVFSSAETGTMEIKINLNSSSTLNVDLYKDYIQLKDVVVTAKAPDANISENVGGQEQFSQEEIKKLPALLGESDVVKVLTTLPGVNVAGDASSGFNVRGGDAGGNLILVDDATIYNSAHLFGIYSAINSDIIGDVKLYKGTIPVKYGGRNSSLLNIELKPGNVSKIAGKGGAGLIASRATVEAPIIKGKSSIIVSGRYAYPNYILNNINNADLRRSDASFADGHMKFASKINDNNTVSITAYGSRDVFNIMEESNFDYNNKAISSRWNRSISNDLTLSNTFAYSSYTYNYKDYFDATNFLELGAQIDKYDFRSEISYSKFAKHFIEGGVEVKYHDIAPGDFEENELTNQLGYEDLSLDRAVESSVFIADDYDISDDFSLYGGIRQVAFTNVSVNNRKTYFSFEPRFSANYRLNARSSVKIGLNRLAQNIHLVSNTVAINPLNIWKLSNNEIKTAYSNQLSLGYFRNFESNNIETSIEAYIKNTENLLTFRNGANLFANPSIEEELIQGQGRSFGIELYAKRKIGKVNGWLSYTFSRAFIQVKGANRQERINRGEFYAADFDQPHNFFGLVNWQVSRRFDISMNFTYNSGRPITIPSNTFRFQGRVVNAYGDRNSYRIPDYHRLDLSFHMGTNLKKEKPLEADWTLTLYNVYGRSNPYSVFFRSPDFGNDVNAYQLTVIGRMVPALTYNFKF